MQLDFKTHSNSNQDTTKNSYLCMKNRRAIQYEKVLKVVGFISQLKRKKNDS